MMKKIFTLAALIMLVVAAMNAQSLNGTWKGDENVTKMLNDDNKDQEMFMLLIFNGNKMDWCFEVSMSDETMGDVTFQFIMPCTFVRTGDTLSKMKLQKDKVDIKVVKCSMGDNMAKLLDAVLKEEMKKEGSSMLSGLEDMAEELAKGTLTIQTLTDTKLVLVSDDEAMTYYKQP